MLTICSFIFEGNDVNLQTKTNTSDDDSSNISKDHIKNKIIDVLRKTTDVINTLHPPEQKKKQESFMGIRGEKESSTQKKQKKSI